MRKIFSLIVSGLIELLSASSGAFATSQSVAPQTANLDWATTFSPRSLSFDVNAVAV